MISELFFVIKVFVTSLVVVSIMKLEWRGHTIEDHVRSSVIETRILPYLHDVAKGANRAIDDLHRKIAAREAAMKN